MTTFKTSPCGPQGNVLNREDIETPYFRVEQSGGETYMGRRSMVLHRDEVDALVAALKAAR